MTLGREHIAGLFPCLLMAGILIISQPGSAQQGNTLYLMHRVPQSNLLNPAVQPECDWVVGIPAISSAHLSYSNTAFTYIDLAGSDTWNIEQVTGQMHRADLITGESMLHTVYLGHRYKSLYFTFHVAERIQSFQTIPGSLARTAVYGNAPYTGETVRFDALRTGGYYLREYGLSLSRRMGPYLTAGVRARMLFGKAAFSTGTADIDLTTGPNSFDLLLEGNYLLNASLPVTIIEDPDGNIEGIELDEVDLVPFLLNRGNPGFLLDLGMIYELSPRTTLSASLLDLGFQRWRTDLHNVSGEGSFSYTGVDPGTDVISFAFFRELRDSLINSFDVITSQDPYTYVFPAQLYLGASHRLNERFTAGLVSRNVIFRRKLHSSVTLSARTRVAGRFTLTASWSYLNHTPYNIGAALAYTGRGFQFHVSSDNLIGFFYPFNTRTLHLRAGLNLMLGCGGKRSKRSGGEAYGDLPDPAECSWSGRKKSREKRMGKAADRIMRLKEEKR